MGKQFNPRAKVYNSLPKSCHIFRQKHVRLCKKNGCGERPLLPEILGQTGPVGAKLTPIFSRYSLVAPQPQGRIQRGKGAGGHAPNRRSSGFFTEKRLYWDCSLYQKCSVGLKYAKNVLAGGDPPRTPLQWGSSRRPRAQTPPPVVWGGDTPPQTIALSVPLAPRFSRLRRSASVAPNVKSWLRPAQP